MYVCVCTRASARDDQVCVCSAAVLHDRDDNSGAKITTARTRVFSIIHILINICKHFYYYLIFIFFSLFFLYISFHFFSFPFSLIFFFLCLSFFALFFCFSVLFLGEELNRA